MWLLLVFTGSAADLVVSLPSWSEELGATVTSEDWVPGADLLTGEESQESDSAPEVQPPTSAEMTAQAPDKEIKDEFLDAYFAKRPETLLVDPQDLLGPSDAHERLTFLDYHSADSQIDFHVYLFGSDQVIPGEVREEEISERLFSEGKPSLTLFYYLGSPERAEIFLSPGLTDAVSDAERRRVLKSSVLAAQEKSDSISQLEAFCVQTSIRIYWIEKAAGLIEGVSLVGGSMVKNTEAEEEPSRFEALKKWFDVFWWDWGAVTTVSLAGLLIALSSCWFAIRRAKYRFPEFDVAPRLGGDHAAGVGAVIGFGSTTQSPSTQHSGEPDYFGGI
ncbi:MAG: hypothetical protein ABJO14_16045 [Haloferula sp.]|uniref:hypothetical protein n=1 Tax=Haloferula sp. TaxID=2497595 RepID=UPI0032A05599